MRAASFWSGTMYRAAGTLTRPLLPNEPPSTSHHNSTSHVLPFPGGVEEILENNFNVQSCCDRPALCLRLWRCVDMGNPKCHAENQQALLVHREIADLVGGYVPPVVSSMILRSFDAVEQIQFSAQTEQSAPRMHSETLSTIRNRPVPQTWSNGSSRYRHFCTVAARNEGHSRSW